MRVWDHSKDEVSLIYEVVFNGILDDFSHVFHVHLLQDSGSVSTHSVGAEEEFLGDFARFLPRSKKAHDFELAVGESSVPGGFTVCVQVIDEFFGNDRGDVLATLRDFSDGLDEFAHGAFLG